MPDTIVIPFIESVPETSRESVTTFVTNTGATAEDLKGFDSFEGFLAGYKPKAAPLDWTSTLPEEDRALLGVKGWKSPADPIKGYKELEKLVGHEKIAMPKKDAQGNYEKGELERVLMQLGMPKDPKGYKVSQGFKLPEGITLDDKFMAEFTAEAHKVGLLPHQYSFVMDKLAGLLQQGVAVKKEGDEKSHNEAMLNLRNKWGYAYDEKAKLANSVLRNFAGDENAGIELMKKYGNDPVVIELLANIGSNLSEDSLTRVNMISSMLTPEAAKGEIQKIRTERTKELNDASDPQHNYWVNRLSELYRMTGAS